MKKLIIIAALACHFTTGFSQIKEFVEEYTYTAGDRDSKDICFAIAKDHLQTTLLDRLGIYVQSESNLNTIEANGSLKQNFNENIRTSTANITKFKVLDQNWDGKKYWLKAAISVDTTFMTKKVKNSDCDDLKFQIKEIRFQLDQIKTIKKAQSGDNRPTELFRSLNGESFTGIALSQTNHSLFLSTSLGQLIKLNQNGAIENILHFKKSGRVNLDAIGQQGAFVTSKMAYIFDQQTLAITDSIESSGRVWFTKNGLVVSTGNAHILDYDYESSKFLIGQWDDDLQIDRKIKAIYLAKDMSNMGNSIFTHESFELSSALFNKGSAVGSLGGNGKLVWIENGRTKEFNSTYFVGMTKINSTTIARLKFNVLPINEQTIKEYGLKLGDNPTQLFLIDINTNQILFSKIVPETPSINNVVFDTKTNKVFYLTSGLNNKLISIP